MSQGHGAEQEQVSLCSSETGGKPLFQGTWDGGASRDQGNPSCTWGIVVPGAGRSVKGSPHSGTARMRWRAGGQGERHVSCHDPPPFPHQHTGDDPNLHSCLSKGKVGSSESSSAHPDPAVCLQLCPKPDAFDEDARSCLNKRLCNPSQQRKCLSQSPAISSWLMPWSRTF